MKLLFISLGCDKNLVDSEHMIAMISEDGIQLTNDETEADVIVVNSCCFISDAMEESIQTLIDMGRLKETASLKYLIVTGCLAERYAKEIHEQLPEVDAVIGTNSYDEIVNTIHQLSEGKNGDVKKPLVNLPDNYAGRTLTTGGHYAHLKIAEGCDKHCTYCVIPSIRGGYRSVPMEKLLGEATILAKSGVQELILVAQEITLYGVDIYGKKSLPELLTKLSEIEGIRWIRLQYCYPEEITDELIDTMAHNPKICHYIDIPIQHANDWILGRMGRKTSSADIKNIVSSLRKAMPDIAIRTTLICGFPGETEDMHRETMDFVKEMKFDRLGCFAYSRQEGTPAAEFDDQVEEETKNLWVSEIMELQQEISAECNRSFEGVVVDAMIEGKVADDNVYVGRTFRDAPDVDGLVFIETGAELMTGDFVKVKITGSYEYDLIGELE
ncbi:MAG: 30S ribosomal protein S12 methylthiotransferase RimO [Lachnospiraceae bacterium]|nr:30S ribosomal protein S12 methylthiotransferase RimO [Lachnospiraceae bacterium]MDD6192430.1 30S ribosomal protein S12 methylthiotransferase RimO [Lachnospiraceae bacterium]MDY4794177.1 30S ribosomal protein S12 methylthiotransferase RimO [Pararoseburia sp.]